MEGYGGDGGILERGRALGLCSVDHGFCLDGLGWTEGGNLRRYYYRTD